MASSSSTRFEVPKFNGSNYVLWKLKMQAVLVKEDCAIAIQGKEKKPVDMPDADFEKKNQLAMADLLLALDDSVLFNVSDETTAKGLWDKLQNLYEGKSMSNQIFLRRQQYNLRMKEGSSLQEHLNEFNTLISRLAAVDVNIEENEKVAILFCSMPDSWDGLIMNLSNTKDLSMESAVSMLLTEESRRKVNESSSSDAMMVRGRSTEKGISGRNQIRSKSKGRRSGRCWNCGKKGHLRKACKSPKINPEKPRPDLEDRASDSKNSHGNLVSKGNSESGEVLSVFPRNDLKDHWIFDSGASFHMTPCRDWFHTYRSCNGGIVYMGDDNSCEIVGVGDVRMTMFDGITRTISGAVFAKESLVIGKVRSRRLRRFLEKRIN